MIVIAGGGIAGLATALALSPVADILVLERRSALASNEGAGIQLAPNAVKALAAIGADEAVRAVAHRPAGLSVFAGRRRLARVPYDGAFQARYGAPSLTAGRAAVHRALLEAALARPNVTLVADRPVERVVRQPGGWSVPGLGGAVEGAALLVAADGVSSAVRRLMLGDEPQDTGWVAWRGRGPSGAMAAGADAVAAEDTRLTLAPGAHLVRYAMAHEDEGAPSNAVYIARAQESAPGGVGGPLAESLSAIADWVPWPIKVRTPHVFHGDAIAYVGDAAHAMRPYLAQGAAMALEDAAVLGFCVRRHGLTDAALSAYAAARAKRVQQVATTSVRQGGIYHMGAPMSVARNLAMTRLGAAGILRRVDWLYRWAPAG